MTTFMLYRQSFIFPNKCSNSISKISTTMRSGLNDGYIIFHQYDTKPWFFNMMAFIPSWWKIILYESLLRSSVFRTQLSTKFKVPFDSNHNWHYFLTVKNQQWSPHAPKWQAKLFHQLQKYVFWHYWLTITEHFM